MTPEDRVKLLEEKVADAEAAYNLLAAASVREVRAVNRELEISREANGALLRRLEEEIGAARAVVEKFLSRPNRVMEIYGQDVYQAAKDTFVSLGGDGRSLPMPKPQGEQDAD